MASTDKMCIKLLKRTRETNPPDGTTESPIKPGVQRADRPPRQDLNTKICTASKIESDNQGQERTYTATRKGEC